MARIFLGFGIATLLWAAVVFGLYSTGYLAFGREEEDEVSAAAEPEADDGEEPSGRKRAKRGRRRERNERAPSAARQPASNAPAIPRGEATTGDDLHWDGPRGVDMAGGEEQLAGKDIEAGFDSAMGRIRRCLVLVPAEGDVTGKLTFGMRVGSDGAPKAVNLTGPAVVTSGESGTCLRKAAEAIRFAKFSGPDMLFKYPITLQ